MYSLTKLTLKLTLNLVFTLMVLNLSGVAMAQNQDRFNQNRFNQHQQIQKRHPQPTAQNLTLKVIDKTQFCARLKERFALYGKQTGYNNVQVAMMATSATSGLIEEFKSGHTTDYISTQTIADFSKIPTKGKQGYVPTSHFISGAMGINQEITLALTVGELRFIPFAQKGREIVVLARSTIALSPARAKKVAEVARTSKIKLNVIWIGSEDSSTLPSDDAKQMAWLAAVTGGSFVNLSDKKDPCGFIM